MTVLDTDSLTLVGHRQARITARLVAEEAVGRPAHLPLPVRIEALRGRFEAVLKAPDAAELLFRQELLVRTDDLLSRFPVVLFDAAAAGHFDRLRAGKRTWKGGRDDLLIACIALAQDATLVTRNTKDFAGIPGLKVENWAD